MKEPIVLGIVGTQPSLWRYLAGCVHSGLVHEAMLVASDEQEATHVQKRFGFIRKICGDVASLWAEGAVEAVLIGGPLEERFPVAKQALQAGKDVILVAPPTQSVAQWDELSVLANKQGNLLLCALDRLHIPAHQQWEKIRYEYEKDWAAPLLATGLLAALQREDEFFNKMQLAEAAFHAVWGLQHLVAPAQAVWGAINMATAQGALLRLEGDVAGQLSIVGEKFLPRGWGEFRVFYENGFVLLRDNPEDEMPLIVGIGAEVSPLRVKMPPDVYEYAAQHHMEYLLRCLLRKHVEPTILTQTRTTLATWEALQQAFSAPRPLFIAPGASAAID